MFKPTKQKLRSERLQTLDAKQLQRVIGGDGDAAKVTIPDLKAQGNKPN
jgi:hypothetical protein